MFSTTPKTNIKNIKENEEDEDKYEKDGNWVTCSRGTPPGDPFTISPNYKPLEDNSVSLLDFEIGKPLSSGKFGQVYLARHKKHKFLVALKIISKRMIIKHKMETQLRREIEIHSRLDHPNIAELYTWFHDKDSIFLVTEFALKGDLYYDLVKDKKFKDEKAANYICQVCRALKFCHKNGIIHRDIKPENILLTHNNTIKLTDFGWAAHARTESRKTMCGTLEYLSPELCKREFYSYDVDIWSIGILLYEFLTGSSPFREATTVWTYERIKKVDLKFPGYVNEDARDFMRMILKKNAVDRPNFDRILEHRWIIDNASSYVLKILKDDRENES